MSEPCLAFPVSTYRLQLNRSFDLDAAAALVPYFAGLGISHLYLSPIWKASPGSMHGYDVCDPAEINPELGGEPAFARFSETAAAHGIGIILDFVPNHMRADSLHNPAWRDLLRSGPSSPFADYFDIDWHPVKTELQNKILLPILGRQYGEVLEAGELRLVLEDNDFALRYWDYNLPLNPRRYGLILQHRIEELKKALAEDEETLWEYQSVLYQLEHLPPYTDVSEKSREDRLREIAIASNRLHKLLESSAAVRGHVRSSVAEFNGRSGDPGSFDLLHNLLEHQVYRLSYWRTAMHEINYRRFFDINDLAGLRMEGAAVFEAVHAKVFSLIAAGRVQGLRLDHIDGLYDPWGYLRELRGALETIAPSFYLVVEKILTDSEPLSGNWPVDGATGYGFLNQINRLYVRPDTFESIRRVYQSFARQSSKFDEVVYVSKRRIISTSMASELNVLALELNRISEQDRARRDFTLVSLQEALREVVACFPVYRTYISDRGISEHDRNAIGEAIARAMRRNPAMESSIFSFLRYCLCPEMDSGGGGAPYSRRLRFAMKFQQYTGPVQAKGVEDTAFYRYCPLASLNEVGGNPARLGAPLEDFHAANADRQAHFPRSMITTATHDTKRGEDARARINVLSEIPGEWRAKVHGWSRLAAAARTRIREQYAPDRNDEYLFYQSLLAAWPAGADSPGARLIERLQQYMGKAVKEAKTHSSWINPSNEYDQAVARFVDKVLSGKPARAFLDSFVPFAHRIARYGWLNSISQLTLKLGSAGATDFYQGAEFWDLTLVDPDNRRAVDFDTRRRWLDEWVRCIEVSEQQDAPLDYSRSPGIWDTGEVKGRVMAAGLRFRRRYPALLVMGSYSPVSAAGPLANHVVACARSLNGQTVVAAGLRWMVSIVNEDEDFRAAAARWGATRLVLPKELAGQRLRNVLTNEILPPGDSVALSQLFRQLPGAMVTAGQR